MKLNSKFEARLRLPRSSPWFERWAQPSRICARIAFALELRYVDLALSAA